MKTVTNEPDLAKEMRHFGYFSTFTLVFFILLMATLRTISNRETKETLSRNQNKSCIDRTIPNKIQKPERIKKTRLVRDKNGRLIIVL